MNKKLIEDYRALTKKAEGNLKRCKSLTKILFICGAVDLIFMFYFLNKDSHDTTYMILSICFAIFMICYSVMNRATVKLMLEIERHRRKIFDLEVEFELKKFNNKSEEERKRAIESYATRLMSKALKIENYTTMGKELSNKNKGEN